MEEEKISEIVEIDGAPSKLFATVKTEIILSFEDDNDEIYLPIHLFHEKAVIEEYVKNDPVKLGHYYGGKN